MFYFIYLFSSLILICNNFANSNEEVRKIVWNCANEKCDTPISDVVTSSKFLIRDSEDKLTFEIGSKGQVYKKPADGSEFWFVKIGNEKGLVKKSHLREQKVHSSQLVKEEGDYPLNNDNNISGGTEVITPSQPRIVDGTPLYDNDLNESDNNESVPLSNSAQSTPHLDGKDSPGSYQTQSTFADIVDQTKSGLQTGDDSNNGTLSPAQNDSLSGVSSNNISDIVKDYASETDTDSKAVSDDNHVGNVGIASITPINYDDKNKMEEEENYDGLSDPSSTNNGDQGEQTNSDILSHDVSQNDQIITNTANNDRISPSETKEEMKVKASAEESVDNSYTPPNNPELEDSVHNQTSDNTSEQFPTEVASNESQPKEPPPPSRYISNRSSYVATHRTRNVPESENYASARNAQDEPAENQFDPSKQFMDVQQNPQYGPMFQPQLNYANVSMSPSPAIDSSTPPPVNAQDSYTSTPSPDEAHDSSTPPPVDAQDSYTSTPSPADVHDYSTPPSLNAQDSYPSTPSPADVHDSSTPPSLNAQDSYPSTPSPADVHDYSTPPSLNAQDSYTSTPSPADVHDSSTPPSLKTQDSYTSTPSPADVHDSSTPPPIYAQDSYTSTPSPADAHDSSFLRSVEDYELSTPLPGNVDSEQNTKEPDASSTIEPSVQEADPETPLVEEDDESSFPSKTSESGLSVENYSEPSNVLSDNSAEESLTNDNEIQSITNDNLSQENKNLEDKTREDMVQNIVETSQEQLLTGATPIRDSSGFYSSVSSFFSSLTELFNKSELPTDRQPLSPIDEKPMDDSTLSTAPSGYCYNKESCGGLERPIGGEDQLSPHWSQQYANVNMFKLDSVPLSFNSIMYICITSVVVLLFSLGYYYIDNSQNSSFLVAKVNQLSQELFVTKKERDTLEDQLLKIKENCNMMDSSKLKQDSKLTTLQKALEDSENSRAQLEEKVSSLEKEVETLMEQGLEMHKLLSDTITDEDRSQMLLSNIDELKESLSEKLNQIVTLTNQLDKKNEEIQLRQIDVRNANDRVTDLERKLESCKADTEESFAKKLQDHQQKNIKLQKLLEEKGVSIARLENELAKTKAERDSAEARASSAEAGLQTAHSIGTGEARQTWLDATAVRAALATANKWNEALQQNISEINSSNKLLQDKISSLNEEMSSLNLKYENVEKEKVNALTKLQVLSDYFKEKETKLQEELGVKESQWLQKETEDHTIYEQMKSLREEIASYKAQNDKLKAEILEQEASYKVQVANEEQKSYDHWVALRQAERKVKELQMESAHFRNRLTQIETANQSSTETLNPNGLDKGSFNAPSPPFMMHPLLSPSEFFPLPPPPIHPTASRPPPLGRISSPQLPGEMIPPPPLVPFDMYPPPPSSTPPPPLPLYKPQPRDRPPPPKDSPPSNYSSESVNDKPPRRRRR